MTPALALTLAPDAARDVAASIPAGGPTGADAVRHHYDVGNNFYQRWLDPTMTYSCALWDGTDDLETAQIRKLDWHARAIAAAPGQTVLDIGCGWGAMMDRLVHHWHVQRAVGLTLSREQARHIVARRDFAISVRLESWADHRPSAPYDGIVSVGAFEHFASPTLDETQRTGVYRAFFQSCRDWLKPGGRLSLQTIAYDALSARKFSDFIRAQIFPDAELPTLGEILAASDGLFRPLVITDDAAGYARTCRVWRRRLLDAYGNGTRLTPEARRFQRYLRISQASFERRNITLLRLVLERSSS